MHRMEKVVLTCFELRKWHPLLILMQTLLTFQEHACTQCSIPHAIDVDEVGAKQRCLAGTPDLRQQKGPRGQTAVQPWQHTDG